jgi:uncharacterized protein YkwD
MYGKTVQITIITALIIAAFGIGFAQIKSPDVVKIDTVLIENLILDKLNAERKCRDLAPLVKHDSLTQLARIQSENMVKYNFFSHTDQNGYAPQQRQIYYFPRLCGGIGENIAYDYGATNEDVAENLIKSWMSSSGHRANILRTSYSHAGIGIVQKGEQFYATQVFGDLIASLETEIPELIPYGSEITLRFKYESVFPKEQLTVFTVFPDKSLKFCLPDGMCYTGVGPCTPVWDGERFLITLKLDRGKGIYNIQLGRNGKLYLDGVKIKVE